MQIDPHSEAALQKFSKNMQQIYRRTPMSNCDFNKVASQLWRSASVYSDKSKSTEKTVIKIKTFSETLIVYCKFHEISTQVTFPRKYKPNERYGTKYPRMDQVKFVEDSL